MENVYVSREAAIGILYSSFKGFLYTKYHGDYREADKQEEKWREHKPTSDRGIPRSISQLFSFSTQRISPESYSQGRCVVTLAIYFVVTSYPASVAAASILPIKVLKASCTDFPPVISAPILSTNPFTSKRTGVTFPRINKELS